MKNCKFALYILIVLSLSLMICGCSSYGPLEETVTYGTPCFSPDGAQILFSRSVSLSRSKPGFIPSTYTDEKGSKTYLYTMDLSSKQVTLITDVPGNGDCSWREKAFFIYGKILYEVNLAEKTKTQICELADNYYNFEFSPQGKYLYYHDYGDYIDGLLNINTRQTIANLEISSFATSSESMAIYGWASDDSKAYFLTYNWEKDPISLKYLQMDKQYWQISLSDGSIIEINDAPAIAALPSDYSSDLTKRVYSDAYTDGLILTSPSGLFPDENLTQNISDEQWGIKY